MPRKIRELKAMLRKAGFFPRPGKGSHTIWEHPDLDDDFTFSGGDGDDAKPYSGKECKRASQEIERGAA